MTYLTDGPIGLTLSGGGSKGAYTVGVLQYLIEVENRMDYKVIYGTSTGALIASLVGAMSVTQDISFLYDKLIQIYKNVNTSDIVQPHYEVAYATGGVLGVLISSVLQGGNSIYSTKPLENLMDRHLTDSVWQKIIEAGKNSNPIEIGFCTTNLTTGKSEIISNISHPNKDILRKALLASSNQPLFMPPVEINSNIYVDGGVMDYNPLPKIFNSPLFDDLNLIVSISLDNGKSNPSSNSFVDIISVLFRSFELLSDKVVQAGDISEAQLLNLVLKIKEKLSPQIWEEIIADFHPSLKEKIEKIKEKKYVPIIHLAPKEKLQGNSLEFNPNEMEELIKIGFNETKDFFNQITPKL